MSNLARLPDLLQAQDWPAAERLLRRAAETRGAGAEVFYNLAKVLEAAGKPDQRAIWLRRAVAKRPGYAMAWFELGRAHLDAGAPAPALAAFEQAARLAPDDAAARRMVARLALRLGDWDKAAAGFATDPDTEADLARYRIAAERGEATQGLRDALLARGDIRPEVLRTLTRTARGSLPLALPPCDTG